MKCPLTAMMIERLNAVVARGAVRASRRSIEVTRRTPLHTHANAIDGRIDMNR